MKENKVLQKIIKKKHKKQKSISPIISVVLMIVIATIIITLVLSWGKGFSNKSLADTGSILKEDSSLTGFIYSSNESPSSYNVKNLSDKEITITSYKIIGTGDSEILGKELVLSEPVNLNSGSSVVLPILCAPDNSFVINLITDEGKYIEVPINKVNSNLNSCNSSSVPDLVCLGLEENGSGNTIDDPFVICSVDDLNNIRAALTKHYKLGINLDLNVSPYNDGNGWEPIGICGPLEYECYIGNYSYTFTGSFNGNNHVISHLYINRPATSYIGLFGYTNEAIIYNLILEDNNIFGSFRTGSLIGNKSGGSIYHIYSTGNLSSELYGGGLIGYNTAGNISESYFLGTISGTGGIGGLIGENSNGTITESFTIGSVLSSGTAGGLVGSSSEGTISKCYSNVAVSGTNNIGGFIGSASGDLISNSYSLGNVIRSSGSETTSFGGFVGDNYQSSITNSYSIGSVSGTGWAPTDKGFVGSVTTGEAYADINNFFNTTTSLQTTTAGNATAKTTTEMKTQSTFTGWDFSTIWDISAGATYPYLRDNTPDPLPQ